MLDFDSLQWSYEIAKFQFVQMELDLAITFAEIAAGSNSQNTVARNIGNSKQAYRVAMKILEGAKFTPEMSTTIVAKIERVSDLLGEKLPHL